MAESTPALEQTCAETLSSSLALQSTEKLVSVEEHRARGLLRVYLLSSLWTIVLTFIPVLIRVPPDTYYAKHEGWYTGNDVIRFLEPIGGLLFNFYIFSGSGILRSLSTISVTSPNEETSGQWKNNVCITAFVLAASLYLQGGAFHSASNMYKYAVEDIMEAHDDALITDLYYWMRTVWMHAIAHYLYAAGYTIMMVCQAFAYRNHVLTLERISASTYVTLVLAALLNGVLLSGVAADYPMGIIVALVFLGIYGFGILGGYLISNARKEIKESLRSRINTMLSSTINPSHLGSVSSHAVDFNTKSADYESMANNGKFTVELKGQLENPQPYWLYDGRDMNSVFTKMGENFTDGFNNVFGVNKGQIMSRSADAARTKNENEVSVTCATFAEGEIEESKSMAGADDVGTRNALIPTQSVWESRYLRFGNVPVLHYFFLSYVFGFILIMCWIGYAGGIKTRKEVMG